MLPVIQSEKLSKAYQIGEFSTGTLSQDIERWWLRMRGKEDKFLKIGETNDRSVKGESNFVWSLKDINFQVEQGDAVGIIGRNGAGKSTLLKILSRVTTPTTGTIKVKGRIASLLEVGTGFHPELTGRENIFLNGAILGMRKKEIKRKFDEIVDFSGVERYIDTPVKRYSSGMYVRLAFAVAAHLESEILIVDEVLAVGDGEFQKKCLGKMQDVRKGQGRTILFVSHDMAAISTLTTHCMYLINGQLKLNSGTNEVVRYYLQHTRPSKGVYFKEPFKDRPTIVRIEILTSEAEGIHRNGALLEILVDVFMPEVIDGMAVSIQIFNDNEKAVVYAPSEGSQKLFQKKGVNRLKCTFPELKLYQGNYYVFVHLAESKGRTYFDGVDKVGQFEVQMIGKIVEWGWRNDICQYIERSEWNTV